jgi:hypothetical protein
MPISPENKHRYPADWPWISHRVKEGAGWKCEHCGVADRAWGYRDRHGYFQEVIKELYAKNPPFQLETSDGDQVKVIQIVLTTAHLDQHPENNAWENLRALCHRCHFAFDRPFNLRKRCGPKPGQLLLWEEAV